MDQLFRVSLCLMVFLWLFDIAVGSVRPGCSVPLGMKSEAIKDDQISAVSWDSGWEPKKGRLDNSRAWCSDDEKPEVEYFQVDLKKVRHVSAVGIQGIKHLLIKYYVETYKVKYSFDGNTWYWYKEWNEATSEYTVKIFTGNSDNYDEEVKSIYRDTFVSRFIRLYPIKFTKDMCIRAEIYGCSDTCSSILTNPSGNITSPNYPKNYTSGSDCTWIIFVAQDKKVTLLVEDFDIDEPHSSGQQCKDFLGIYDGPLDRSNYLGSYCNGLPHPMVVQSTGNTVRLRLLSVANRFSHKGFRIQYLSTTQGVDDVHTAVACEGKDVHLSCISYSSTINILHVFYGSYPHSLVCHGPNVASSACSSPAAATEIITDCQHYKSCNVTVDSTKFGQPCAVGVVPRLEVYYQCTSTTIKTRPPLTPPTAAPTLLPSKPYSVSQAPGSIAPSPTLPLSPLANSTVLYVTVDRTEIPSTLVSSTIVTVTPSTPNQNDSTAGDGNKAAREGSNTNEVTIAVSVLATLAVIAAVIVGLCLLYRRRRKQKQPSGPVVEFRSGDNSPENASNRHHVPSSNEMYDSLNLLYESGDTAGKANESENVYETPEVDKKVSQNLLYESANLTEDNGYETVSPQVSNPKGICVSNPGYEKMLEINQAPQNEKIGP